MHHTLAYTGDRPIHAPTPLSSSMPVGKLSGALQLLRHSIEYIAWGKSALQRPSGQRPVDKQAIGGTDALSYLT